MKRDGAQKSIWQENIPDYQPVNTWDKDKVYDVLIVGGGITGLTTALLLQSEGRNCIVAEAANLGFGTTGGTTAHLNTILDTPYYEIAKSFSEEDAKLVATGSREAIDLVEGLINKYNIDCDFSYETGYLMAENDKEIDELEKIKESSNKAGVVMDWVADGLDIPIPHKRSCRIALQAKFHAIKYIMGLARAFEEAGGVILQHCTLKDVDSGEHHIADTTLGKVRASFVVYATHIPPGISVLHFRCAPYRSYAAAFTLKSGNYPTGLYYDLKEPYHYFRTQTIDGKEYIIGGGFDHKTGHEENTDVVFRKLEAYLRTHFDIDTIAYRWSSQYFNPADGLPYIGVLPGHDTIFTGTGYAGNGMIFGTLSGKIFCDLIMNKESKYEKVFNPNRIKPIAGFTEFVKENADVVSEFIGKRFSYEKVSELAELAPGEGKLAEWDGKKVALYKDENGKVYAVDPVCPHAKCIVDWNIAEKSWDCPCHGSRFSCNGAMLTGPATTDLQQLLWEEWEGD